MYSEKIEALINAALADGELTEKEKRILFKRAEEEGIDLDEFEMVLDARLVELKNKEKQATPPKSNKLGSIKKCPACGAIVNSFDGICAECGFAFDDIQASHSSEKLFELLKRAKTDEEEEKIIKSFPIPMAKADLLEFISKLHTEVFDYNGNLKCTWGPYYEKYGECIEKCKISFRKDPQIRYYIDEFVKACSVNDKKEKGEEIGTYIFAICGLCGAAAFCVWAYFAEFGIGGWIGAYCGGTIVGMIIGAIIRAVVINIRKKQ